MIRMDEAFSSDTSTTLKLFVFLNGSWDADNQWQPDGYAPPIDIIGTPIPIGERQTGTHGENLTPDPTGERIPASMKFTSQTELNLNDVIVYRGINYKMSRKGDYNAAGFFTNVGITLATFEGNP